MTDVVARAKAALEGVTEGPWEVSAQATPGYSPHYGVASQGRSYPNVAYAETNYEGYGNGSRKADAEFISEARSLVPDLVAEVERLRYEVSEGTAGRIHRQWTAARRQVKELRAELARLRAAAVVRVGEQQP